MTRAHPLALISIAALSAACSPSYAPSSSTSSANSAVNSSSTGGSTVSTSPTPNPYPTSTTGGSALISNTVTGIGYTSETVTVKAGSVLKMTFTPGQVASTYSQLGVYITVNGMIQNTGMLYNGINIANGQPETSPILDFSTALPSTCVGSTGCRESVQIVIDHPNDDYYCLNFGEYCYWTQVPSGQGWNGTLSIQTDDTVALTN